MPDRSPTGFLTGMLRRGARPLEQIGHGFGTSLARTTASTQEDFSTHLQRPVRPDYVEGSREVAPGRRMAPASSTLMEDRAEDISLEKSHSSFPLADTVTGDSHSPRMESPPEESGSEVYAPVIASSFKRKEGTVFQPMRREPQNRSDEMDREAERISPDSVESSPDALNEISSLLPSVQGWEYEAGREPSPDSRERTPPAQFERRPTRREFRIIEPPLPAPPIQSVALDGLAGSAPDKESNRIPSQSERPPSLGHARFQNVTTTAFDEGRESSGSAETETPRISIELNSEPERRERQRAEPGRREVNSMIADEISMKESRRRQGGQFHQERGSRVAIDRLDIQIINQPPPAPPAAAPRASAPATDERFVMDRQLLGRFDLNG